MAESTQTTSGNAAAAAEPMSGNTQALIEQLKQTSGVNLDRVDQLVSLYEGGRFDQQGLFNALDSIYQRFGSTGQSFFQEQKEATASDTGIEMPEPIEVPEPIEAPVEVPEVPEVPEVSEESTKEGEAPTGDMTGVTEEPTESEVLASEFGNIQGYSDQIEPIQANFLEKRQEYLSTLGRSQTAFTNVLVNWESENGVAVDTTNSEFQSEVQNALAAGASAGVLEGIFEKYRTGGAGVDAIAPDKPLSDETRELMNNSNLSEDLMNSAISSYNEGVLNEDELSEYLSSNQSTAVSTVVEGGVDGTGTAITEFTYEEPGTFQFQTALEDFDTSSPEGLANAISSMLGGANLSEVTSAVATQALLTQLQIEGTAATYEAMKNYYDKKAERATDAYNSAFENYSTATDEITGLIEGTSDVATTLEALSVRAAKETKELGLTSVEATEASLEAKYEMTYKQMSDQNARLESYMKVKFNYMGAQDSSASVTTFALAIDNAQMRLMTYQQQHSAEMVQLEVEKTQLLNDYYNSVTEQLIKMDSKKSEALTNYYDKLDEIEGQELVAEQELTTDMLTALGDFTSNVYTIEQDQKEWEYQLAQDYWDRTMAETELANQVQNQIKVEAGANLDRLLSAYAGLPFDQLPAEVKQSMTELSQQIGLPVEYASGALDSVLRSMVPTGGSGSGSGPGSGDTNDWGYDEANSAILDELLSYANENGLSISDAVIERKDLWPSDDRADVVSQAYGRAGFLASQAPAGEATTDGTSLVDFATQEGGPVESLLDATVGGKALDLYQGYQKTKSLLDLFL